MSDIFENLFNIWMGNNNQMDDVLLFGIQF